MNELDVGASDEPHVAIPLEALARTIAGALDVPAVAIALLDPASGALRTQMALGFQSERARPRSIRMGEDIEGWVAAHLAPLTIFADTRVEPRADAQHQHITAIAPYHALRCVPLLDDTHFVGTLLVASYDARTVTPEAQVQLDALAHLAAMAIVAAQQGESARAETREARALLDAARALTGSLEPEHTRAAIVASARKIVACDGIILYARAHPEQRPHAVAGWGPAWGQTRAGREPLSEQMELLDWVTQHHHARVIAPAPSPDAGQVSGAQLCVPLMVGDVVSGAIWLARGTAFRTHELAAVARLGGIFAATLANSEAHQTARIEREQLAAIFTSASDSLVVVDNGLRIQEANVTFTRLLGQSRAALLGQVCCEVLGGHRGGGCMLCGQHCLVARTVAAGETVPHAECDLSTRALSEPAPSSQVSGPRAVRRIIDFSITPVAGSAGRSALLVGRDVSAARVMDQMKASFLSMLSHELRAPLQAISGFIDLTLAGGGGELTAPQEEFLRRARTASEHLTALVDDLLLISSRDAGKFTLHPRETELVPIIEQAVEELELLAEEAHARVDVRLLTPLPAIAADALRLGQVLRNLLSNAIKFSHSGGVIHVTGEATADAIVLRVADDGVGIPPEHQAHIFERFYQVDTDASPHGAFRGQGLGLAIVRIIIEGHGGSVRVESTPGAGSTFTVTLPRAPTA